MLRVTADIFSGRPNPSWVVGDEAEARTSLRALTGAGVLADTEPAEAGLGFRGLWVEPMGDELASDYKLTGPGYLAVGPFAAGNRAAELAERLIGLAPETHTTAEGEEGVELRAFLSAQLDQVTQLQPQSQVSLADEPGAAPTPGDVEVATTCSIEFGAFNPGFWNNDANVRANNNCYNYASNWRTDTFAQPGRGCGNQYRAITCDEVGRGALCDGMHHRFDCFPDSEKPRYLVALVIAPGPGFVDFHWFRKQREGFWGHKPGGTAARNYDNSGNIIYNPETADRGPYTIFCGYFYGCNSQRQRIR
jgi:hypothetical protein